MKSKILLIIFMNLILLLMVSGIFSLNEGIVSYYRFDEGTGTNASDETGLDDMTVPNSWIADGFNGSAFKPDGSNGFDSGINLGDLHGADEQITINFWFNQTDSFPASAWWIDASPDAANGKFRFYHDGGNVDWNIQDNSGSAKYGNFPTPSIDEWHMFTIQMNSTSLRIYLDGVINASQSLDNYIWKDNTFHLLETTGGALDWDANGRLDEFAIFNSSLTQADITLLYNEGIGLLYPFSSEIITLNSPVNNYFSPLIEVEFNATTIILGGETIVNMSLWHNGTGTWHRNQTEIILGSTNTSILNSTFPSGDYIWTYEACKSDGECFFSSENRTLSIDVSVPLFSDFADNSKTLTYNGTANFNVTVTNTNGTVLLEYDGVNYTATNLTANEYNVSILLLGDNSSIRNYTWYSFSAGHFVIPDSSSQRQYIVYPINRVCFNTTHPDFPDKFLCSEPGNNSLSFLFNISYFRKDVFSNNSKTWNTNYSGEENQTINITMHRYDEVVNFSVNISGTGNPENTLFYGLNNSVIDRFFPGYVSGNEIFDNRTTDYNGTDYVATNKINLTYGIPSSKTIYFWMDDNAKLSSMTFNLSAVGYGFSYNNNFNITFDEDPLLTNTINEGSYITTQGTDLKNFTYDDFEDDSIDTKRWTHGFANGAGSGGGYSWTIANTEENGYMKSEVDDFHEVVGGSDSATHALNNYFYANYSLLNTWTTHAVLFNISYYSIGRTENAVGQTCSRYNNFNIGDVEYWRSHEIPCLNDRVTGTLGCSGVALTDENLIFTLERQTNNSWMVKISGIERNYGQYLFNTGGENYNCGTKTTTYNYNTGIVYTTYSLHPHVACTDSSTALENSFYVGGLSSNLVEQIYFNQHVGGTFQNNENGCKSIDSITYYHDINNSLYYRSNGTFISDSVYSASGDVGAATITLEAYGTAVPTNSEDVTLYLSADEGENWESVSDGVEHSFSNPSTQIKWRADFNITDPGYKNATTFVNKVNITVESGDPTNVTFDFGDDGIIDYTLDGIINETNGTFVIDLSSADLTTEFLKNPLSPYSHLHSVPLVISSDSVGQINLVGFNLTYNPNPIKLNIEYVQDYLDNSSDGFQNISFNVESINGSIDVSDLRYDYRGGNDTIQVTAYQENNVSNNETFNINVFYSSFYKNLPYTWTDYIFFLPRSYDSKGVSAYGQSDTIPVYNFTNTNYGGRNLDMFFYLNDSASCIDMFASTNNTKPSSSLWDGLVSYWSFDIDARDDEGDNDGTIVGAINVDGEKQDGLVAWYKFDADGDLQDYANHFPASSSNLSTITWNESGKYGGGYKLDNTDVQDKIKFGNSSDFEVGNHTFVVWAKPISTKSHQYIFDHYNWRIKVDSGGDYKFTVGRMMNDSGPTNASGNSYTVEGGNNSVFEWTQLVGVYSPDHIGGNGIIRMYVNGIEVENRSIERQRIWPDYGNDEAQLGNSDHGETIPYNGSVDDVRIYNQSLNADEIFALYERRLETLGNAYEFDAVNDFINISNNFSLTGLNFTASFWYKRNGVKACGAMVGKGTGTSTSFGFQIYEDCGDYTGKIKYFIGNGSNFQDGHSNIIQNDIWNMITLVYLDGINTTIYVNGIEDNDDIVSNYFINDSIENNIFIGRGVWATNYLNGSIDEVKIYNRSLSSSEISELYNRSVNKYYDVQLNNEWNLFSSNRPYLFNEKVWLWIDLNDCNASVNRYLTPNLEIKSNCVDCVWGE